jgi:hypothetical protein
MLDGIIDNLKIIGPMVFRDRFKPTVDEDGNLIQSRKQSGEYVKRFKKRVEDGEILRYSMHCQMSPLGCYKEFDDYTNKRRKEEVDRLNEKYYGKEKYLKLKQCT